MVEAAGRALLDIAVDVKLDNGKRAEPCRMCAQERTGDEVVAAQNKRRGPCLQDSRA